MSKLRFPVTSRDHVRGAPGASVTLLEYGDYECPVCGAAQPIVDLVRAQFGSRLRFVFRHFPLTQVHPNAESAAASAEFAGAHRRFWEMHDSIYENQDRLGLPFLFALVEALGLSVAELREALASATYAPKVKNDFLGGVRSGVAGTPTFFINGIRYHGYFEFDDLVAAIEPHLNIHGKIHSKARL